MFPEERTFLAALAAAEMKALAELEPLRKAIAARKVALEIATSV